MLSTQDYVHPKHLLWSDTPLATETSIQPLVFCNSKINKSFVNKSSTRWRHITDQFWNGKIYFDNLWRQTPRIETAQIVGRHRYGLSCATIFYRRDYDTNCRTRRNQERPAILVLLFAMDPVKIKQQHRRHRQITSGCRRVTTWRNTKN